MRTEQLYRLFILINVHKGLGEHGDRNGLQMVQCSQRQAHLSQRILR